MENPFEVVIRVTLQLFMFSKICLLRNHSQKNTTDVMDKPFRALIPSMVCSSSITWEKWEMQNHKPHPTY